MSFSPAMSTKAMKAKGLQVRAWHINRRTGTDLSGLAEDINPQVRGLDQLLRAQRARTIRSEVGVDDLIV